MRKAIARTSAIRSPCMPTQTPSLDTAQVEVGKVDTAKFDDAYFKAAEKKKGSSKKTEGEFFNEVCGSRGPAYHCAYMMNAGRTRTAAQLQHAAAIRACWCRPQLCDRRARAFVALSLA